MLVFLIGSIAINNINWYNVLNVDNDSVPDISKIINYSFLFFCLNFILKFIGNVYQAKQLPAINYLIAFAGHLLSLVLIYILTKTIEGSLFWVAIVYSASPPLVYLICYPITFKKLYPYLSPSLRYFKKALLRDLLSLSIVFFILQIMGIVLFSLSNIVISNMFGPDQVTPYNIAYRYFSVVSMLFSLFLAPIWSASTDAYVRGELEWIKNCIKKLSKAMLILLAVIVVMVAVSPIVYRLWIGGEVEISFQLSLLMGIYMFILMWSLSFSSVLNGLGILYMQMFNIIGMSIFFYPVCLFLGNKYGVVGIVIAMCTLNIPGAILNTIQLYKITNRSATGIWIK